MFEKLPLQDLVRIAGAGGGVKVHAVDRPTDELMRIAEAALRSNARVVLTGLTNRSVEELCRIASAGRGCVEFHD